MSKVVVLVGVVAVEPGVVALVAALLASVTSLAAAGLSFWGGRQARRLARTAQHTERFGKAAEQIGSEEPAVRLAGVAVSARRVSRARGAMQHALMFTPCSRRMRRGPVPG